MDAIQQDNDRLANAAEERRKQMLKLDIDLRNAKTEVELLKIQIEILEKENEDLKTQYAETQGKKVNTRIILLSCLVK